MSSYEYTVIPAPARGEKVKGAKTGIERFAATISDTLNQMAQDGWDYVRAETLPAEERSGLTSRSTVYHNLLIFRRPIAARHSDRPVAEHAAAPTPSPVAAPVSAPAPAPATSQTPSAATPTPVNAEQAAPVRPPFSQPMRSTAAPVSAPAPVAAARSAEPPLTRTPVQTAAPTGPRLGPANR